MIVAFLISISFDIIYFFFSFEETQFLTVWLLNFVLNYFLLLFLFTWNGYLKALIKRPCTYFVKSNNILLTYSPFKIFIFNSYPYIKVLIKLSCFAQYFLFDLFIGNTIKFKQIDYVLLSFFIKNECLWVFWSCYFSNSFLVISCQCITVFFIYSQYTFLVCLNVILFFIMSLNWITILFNDDVEEYLDYVLPYEAVGHSLLL